MARFVVLTFLLLPFFPAASQDINGFWKGTLMMEPGGCFPVYHIEFQLQTAGVEVRGNSYHYSDTSHYVKEEFEGHYDSVKKTLRIEEQKVSIFRIPADCIPCIKNYSLTYHSDGKEAQLRGTWAGRTMDGKNDCPPGTIVMTRILKPAFEPALPPVLIERKLELVKEIHVRAGELRLDFYDNGVIDGDIISVYVNGSPVVSRRLLGSKPISIYIRVDALNPRQEMIMVGENLGSIPPNTALMVVNDGEKRHQVYLASDDKKNAMVRFIYNPAR